jgi:hypothetical protein
MKTKLILSLFTSLLLAVFFGGALSVGMDLNPFACMGGSLLISFFPSVPAGALGMAIQKEIWVEYIIENLFKNNAFLESAFNHDDYVIGGKVVHEPNAGAKPGVKKNRSTLPATVVKRNDTDNSYVLDEYTTDPILIPNAETVELSYDKIASVLSELMGGMQESVADWMLQNWKPNTSISTTGNAVAAHIGTGNRKLLVIDNIVSLKKSMNKANILKEDRNLLLDSDMMEQLHTSLRINQNRDSSIAYDLVNGSIKRIEGFELHERSDVYAAEGSTIQLPDWTPSAEALAGGLAWQKNCVARAKGEIDFFEDLGNPTYFGDIYSALVRAGGRVRRQAGCVALLQDTAV